MSPVACGLRASASATCIAETIEALGRSDIRAGETEWRNLEALPCVNSCKIDSIPWVGERAKILSQHAVLSERAPTGPQVKRGNRKRKPMFLG